MTRSEAIKLAHDSLDAIFSSCDPELSTRCYELALSNLLDYISIVRWGYLAKEKVEKKSCETGS